MGDASNLKTIRRCLAADAARIKPPDDHATVFGVVAQDANKHMLCLFLSVLSRPPCAY